MKIQNVHWYNYQASECIKLLESSEIGIPEKEALRRLKTFGFNRLPQKRRASTWLVFFRQFKSILVYILLGAAVISLVLNEYVDFAIIMAAILINVIVGFLQENKAENQLEHLREFISFNAKVIRDGVLHIVKAEELVPGDIVELEPGDQVPADIRLLEVNNLSSAEAVLTGESEPVMKHTRTISTDKTKKILVSERKNMVLKGTLITDGRGRGIVVATGRMTELGKIAEMLEQTEDEVTPLQQRLKAFSRVLGFSIIGAAFLIVAVGLLRGFSFWDIFLVAMAAAVSAVPEGLLVAVTVVLAIGMQRILKKQALVRKLVAAETLGSTSVICVDKTGTITQGQMQAKEIVFWHSRVLIDEDDYHDFSDFINTSLLVNNATIDHFDGHELIGSPTEKALLSGSLKLGFDPGKVDLAKRLFEIPFNSRDKRMLTLSQHNDQYTWAMKGAPEVVLSECNSYFTGKKKQELTPSIRLMWQKLFDSYSERGYRILAVAKKDILSSDKDGYMGDDYLFLGFWVIHDPLRSGIADTINLVKQAGIRTIMITGDHRLTATEIARQIGLPVTKDSIMDGYELLTLSLEQLRARVKHVSVFARVSPADKLKIVEALQFNNEVVAMTGDGVNDAPALKAADIGIAVGTGTDVTKQSADMILLDNNFQTIVMAIEQGRIIFSNIKKVIVYLLADSFSEMILVIGSLFLGLPLPITAAQILWINLITDGFPAAALTVESGEKNIMEQIPVKREGKLLDREMKTLIFVIGIFSDLVLFSVYYWFLHQGVEMEYLRTIMFAGLGLNSLMYVFSCKSLIQPLWKINIFDNIYLIWAVIGGIILQLVPIYVPILQQSLGLRALGLREWAIVVGLGVMQVALIEITKIIFYSKHHKNYESIAQENQLAG
ncbi:ATPase [Candidatus Falkowbacteria bacterium CG10_big_fil_rev_8_21_14_0_10_39_11]|uniref:ATPase n=1 Tax=Candidatus Falkowbacteria bacterium CG10_big_fil_rev_8_21_14_0_10_39_11 TaxID=1974565 RepID=A0A2H0V623_9BACT|nr:MAG: ATPase [Candidatus Falkowbacteria bacterium CG10_big_fil_rev_8_21_14_0_10_39_11]